MKPAAHYDALGQAALCQAKPDWLVGINATRHFSLLYGRTLNVRRVMTPTLAMLVGARRISPPFQPSAYYHVRLDCGSFGRKRAHGGSRRRRSASPPCAVTGSKQVVSVETIERREQPPRLYI